MALHLLVNIFSNFCKTGEYGSNSSVPMYQWEMVSLRSVKTIAARKLCSIPEVVYWYNAMPKSSILTSMAPSNVIYTYNIHIQGINTMANPELQDAQGEYQVGDAVWVRIPHSGCMTKSRIGWVTGINSPHSVLVNGNPSPFKKSAPFLRNVCAIQYH